MKGIPISGKSKTERVKAPLLHLVFFTACSSFLFGCIGSRELMRDTPANQDLISVHSINGNFSNQSLIDTSATLWYLLYDSYSFHEDTTIRISNSATINLTLNQKSLVVLAKEGDTIVGEFELKGKIRGDYFCANRNLFFGSDTVYLFSSARTAGGVKCHFRKPTSGEFRKGRVSLGDHGRRLQLSLV